MDPPSEGPGRSAPGRHVPPAPRKPPVRDTPLLPPDFDRIVERDLRDDARLRLLYIEAVRRRYWPNTTQAALEFVCYAEKALLDDTRGTPGKLFYALVKRKDGTRVSQATENHVMRRFPSHLRQELVEAADAASVPKRTVKAGDGDVEEAVIGRDIGYAHAVMLQCFLPQHPIADRDYETAHGRASLVVEAGRLADPDQPLHWIRCDVPTGSKPRLILPYIVGQAVRAGSPEVDLGNSLREFMARLRMPVTGHNGKALTEQIQNLAAANITIGEWTDEAVHTHTSNSHFGGIVAADGGSAA